MVGLAFAIVIVGCLCTRYRRWIPSDGINRSAFSPCMDLLCMQSIRTQLVVYGTACVRCPAAGASQPNTTNL